MWRKNFILLTLCIVMVSVLFLETNAEETGFENPVGGSTGFSSYKMPVYKSIGSGEIVEYLEEGQSFLIENEVDGWWEISSDDLSGYVDSSLCLINLPDILPNILYSIVNSTGAIFKSSGYDLPGVSGEVLYSFGKVYNYRLGREEYIVPVSYTFAKKLSRVYQKAKAEGYNLKIYDAYRPKSVSAKIRDSLNSLYSDKESVRTGINVGEGGYSWGQGWFLAQSVSAHNFGCAVDVVLVESGTNWELSMPSPMHELSTLAIKYVNPNESRVSKQGYASTMTSAAKKLNELFLDEGLVGLPSEWWHFQDNDSISRLRSISNGFDFQTESIVSKKW